MSKSISTSTLNLRFMQNAQRGKQLKEEDEADRAPVKDDGQWEVAQEVRDAWRRRLTSQPQSLQSVVQEESYLPFLFPSEQLDAFVDGVPIRPKGRRTFDKKGKELAREPEPNTTGSYSHSLPAPQQTAPPNPRVHPRPVPISALPGRTKKLRFFQQPDDAPQTSKTAKQAIYDNTGVGADLHPPPAILPPVPPLANGFLKPSGVDDPADLKPKLEAGQDIVPGARRKKAKRKRDFHGRPEGEGKKDKKKKQSVD